MPCKKGERGYGTEWMEVKGVAAAVCELILKNPLWKLRIIREQQQQKTQFKYEFPLIWNYSRITIVVGVGLGSDVEHLSWLHNGLEWATVCVSAP